jgi:uncharacterized protein (TIGR02246 family)
MRAIAFPLIIGGLALAACEVNRPGTQDDSQMNSATSDDAAAVVSAVEQSWQSGLAEEAMKHYAPDAVVFSTGKLEPTRDRNVVTQETAGFMAMKPADFIVTERNTQKLDDDTLVSSGIVGFTAQVGPARQMLRARFTQVLQKQADGRWLIVHEHMSLPPTGSALP